MWENEVARLVRICKRFKIVFSFTIFLNPLPKIKHKDLSVCLSSL